MKTNFATSGMRKAILHIIDWFYFPPLSRWVPVRTFRYMFCGGFSTGLDILLFFISYHYILRERVVHLPFIAVSPYIAAFILAFCVSFPTGFLLSKFVVFPESQLRGRTQLFRYLLVVLCNVLLNYFFLKLFIEWCHFFPTIAKIFTTIIVVSFTYLAQKQFTFRIPPDRRRNSLP
ncbi:GtrA family protein [Compostibacter hankyongensis]|uniref:GtrA/DPMS transmembrane domain-containing protein n=1 Tax=Compostibacter hankyongensis TaxID=1007089 RepID=A0ABP8FHJ9_9BACT